MKTVLVTGGSGFIGSNFLNLFVKAHPDWTFVNVDKLTYAGNPLSTARIHDEPNYFFERADICDQNAITRIFETHKPDRVIHFAAESHVDRSILDPREFLNTNVMGTFTLLETCRNMWPSFENRLFLHIGTDEVYGSLGKNGLFDEKTPYNPSSPYSASKAAGDHMVRAYHRTYDLPVIIATPSNNYGPYQFPEKLIPLTILNALEDKPLPVYGKGDNMRDWLHVQDNCEAIWLLAGRGTIGQTYNICGLQEKTNLEVVRAISDAIAEATKTDPASKRSLVEFVTDRPGHDFRYAGSAAKMEKELNWRPTKDFKSGINETIRWYMDNPGWVESVRTGDYRSWLKTNYSEKRRRWQKKEGTKEKK